MPNSAQINITRQKAELIEKMLVITERMAGMKHDYEFILSALPLRQKLMDSFDSLPKADSFDEESQALIERIGNISKTILALDNEIAKALEKSQNAVLDEISKIVNEKKRLAKQLSESSGEIGTYLDKTE